MLISNLSVAFYLVEAWTLLDELTIEVQSFDDIPHLRTAGHQSLDSLNVNQIISGLLLLADDPLQRR